MSFEVSCSSSQENEQGCALICIFSSNRTSKILRTSRPLCLALAQPPFFKRIAETLSRKSKPTTRLTLLRMLKTIGENHPDRASLVERFGLTEIVDRLASQDEAVLVREVSSGELQDLIQPDHLYRSTHVLNTPHPPTICCSSPRKSRQLF